MLVRPTEGHHEFDLSLEPIFPSRYPVKIIKQKQIISIDSYLFTYVKLSWNLEPKFSKRIAKIRNHNMLMAVMTRKTPA